jgi:hypothetical protein
MRIDIMQSNPSELLTVKQLAELIGVNTHTVRLYIENGMPVAENGGKGIPHKIDMRDAWKWAFETRNKGQRGRPKQAGEDDRIQAIKIEMAEIELAKKRGDLFHLGDWVPLIEEALIAARQRFVNISGDFQSEFSDTPDADRMSRWIKSAIADAMRSMARGLMDVPQQTEGRDGLKRSG